MSEETIVWKQFEAYNARNLELFSSCFSNDIDLYNFEETQPILSGLDELKRVYKDVFDTSPELNATIVNKMVFDNKIIYHEKVTDRINKTLEVIAIYEVKDNLICRLTFLRK